MTSPKLAHVQNLNSQKTSVKTVSRLKSAGSVTVKKEMLLCVIQFHAFVSSNAKANLWIN